MTNIVIIDKARSVINDPERPDILPLDDIGTISAALAIAKTVLRRTAEHDKAREEGRLVELPCKVGDTLYCLDRNKMKILNRTVDCFTVGKDGYISIWFGTTVSINKNQIGKAAFLTRVEAEAALHGGDGTND